MEFLVILAVLVALSGPAAFIIVMCLISKVCSLSRQIRDIQDQLVDGSGNFKKYNPEQVHFLRSSPAEPGPIQTEPESTPIHEPEDELKPEPVSEPAIDEVPEPASVETNAVWSEVTNSSPKSQSSQRIIPLEPVYKQDREQRDSKQGSLEQKIGTQWILIAGIITVLIGVGMFLKYAYDNFMLTYTARTILVASAGLICLVIGEVTRRFKYDIVAKGVTALGFALLYGSVFAAYHLYGLIGMTPAFLSAVGITIAAMLYATILDEVIIAFISLLGGFGAALLVTEDFTNPYRLFVYIILLSVGAMSIAALRKWRSINLLTFIGTYAVYVLWMDCSFEPVELTRIAVSWLWIFYAIYMIMPVIYELIRKVNSKIEDVILILLNSLIVFGLSWFIFEDSPKGPMAMTSVVLAVSNLLLALIVTLRNRQDIPLRISLAALGLCFVTIAIPLYFGAYWLTFAWVVEGGAIAVIGLSYRNIRFQIISFIPILLGLCNLISMLPMHISEFTLFFNADFGMWALVSASLLAYHFIFRFSAKLTGKDERMASELTYILSAGAFFFAVIFEWFQHCHYNISGSSASQLYLCLGLIVIILVKMFVFTIRPVSPKGDICPIVTFIASIAGSACSIWALSLYDDDFYIFANINFVFAMLFMAGLLGVAWLTSINFKKYHPESSLSGLPILYTVMFAALLLILITEQIWVYCDNMLIAGQIVAHMWISITWGIYGSVMLIIGFALRNRPLRYSALCLFAVMLGKVFIIDTQNIGSMYRITAFIVTGVILVAISYLYQHLKKKGFFEKLAIDYKN